jgi:O-antigen ligase
MGIFKKTFTYRIYFYLFLALAVAFPIHNKLAPPIISLIGINWLLELNFGEKLRRIKALAGSRYLLSFAILYVLYMIGTLYSGNLHGQAGALFNLEVKMSLWVFPLLFSTIDFERFGPDFGKKVLKAFVAGTLISLFLIFNKAVFNYFQAERTDVFYYTLLAYPQHPSYLAMFFTFTIAILLVWLFDHFRGDALKRSLVILLILLFQLFIVLLSSKAGILSVVIMYVLMIAFHLLHRGEKKGTRILLATSLLALFLVNLSFFPRSYSRFYSAETALEQQPEPGSSESSVARILVWRSSLEIIRAHPIFGVGTGDVEPELMEVYRAGDVQFALDESLNAHNQYLQTFIALGLVGFLVLAVLLAAPAWFAFRRKHLLYLVLLVVFSFNLLVESMLERQAGVVFYGFLNSFLFYYSYRETRTSGHQFPPV